MQYHTLPKKELKEIRRKFLGKILKASGLNYWGEVRIDGLFLTHGKKEITKDNKTKREEAVHVDKRDEEFLQNPTKPSWNSRQDKK